MIYYVIPARKGSKGLPFKNRKLFKATAETVKTLHRSVIVSTDDEEIVKLAEPYGFNVVRRPEEYATDEASTREVLLHVSGEIGFASDDILVMLYLTYPERTIEDIGDGIMFFKQHHARSMLCRIEPLSNPCLMMYDKGLHGVQVIKQDLCRRQEYPWVFEISHYLFICECGELPFLNRNLYNDDTIFWPIRRRVDVDTPEDFGKVAI